MDGVDALAIARGTLPPHMATFVRTCDALGVPSGAKRLDAFLALPEEVRVRIWGEVLVVPDAAPAEEAERP